MAMIDNLFEASSRGNLYCNRILSICFCESFANRPPQKGM